MLRPGAPFLCTFSNRCFPTKAIRGWPATDDGYHVRLVAESFRRSTGWDEPRAAQRPTPWPGDPIFAVWAQRSRLSLGGRPRPPTFLPTSKRQLPICRAAVEARSEGCRAEAGNCVVGPRAPLPFGLRGRGCPVVIDTVR